jgi:hypothetical protein
MVRLVKAFVLGALVGVSALASSADPIPPGPDFVTCGCLDGTLVEFCSGCEDIERLCEESCRGYGNGTLFTACMPEMC